MLKFLICLMMLSAAQSTVSQASEFSCEDLFSTPERVFLSIEDLVSPSYLNQRFSKNTEHDKNFKRFLIDYADHIEALHEEQFADAVYGKNKQDFVKLGFTTPDEARALKESVIQMQINFLSRMSAKDLTPLLEKILLRTAERMYQPGITKDEVLNITIRLHKITLIY